MNPPGAFDLAGPEATEALGAVLARQGAAPCVIHLRGDLGTGKTTLVRGYLRALGHPGRVKSPTYSLVETYDLDDERVFHLDLYRLSDPGEAAWLALEELERESARVLVEWPERGGDWLPPADLVVALAHAGRARRAELAARTAAGHVLLRAVTTDGFATR